MQSRSITMNYKKHYDALIDRALNRKIDGYYEKHHIKPKCIGGSDKLSNIVKLTAREHYIAHQLLVKIYPLNTGLINAANMMCTASFKNDRSQNKLYEWLRKKLSDAQKIRQSGKSNSNYGKIWIFNKTIKINKKIEIEKLEFYIKEGWVKGRVINWQPRIVSCSCCNRLFEQKTKEIFCSIDCKKNSRGYSFQGREEELIMHYNNLGSLNKAVKAMGFPGAVGAWYKQAKKIIDEVR